MSPMGTPAPALAIGIDVGGTKTALGIVSPDGALGPTQRIENAGASGPKDLLARVAECTRHLASQAPGETMAAVGVGLPELPTGQAGAMRSTSSASS